MVSQAEKRRMQEYLMDRLTGSNDKVELVKKKVIGSLDSDYIFIGAEGLVILVDRPYPNESFNQLVTAARRSSKTNMAFVFYKDGKLFFRDAANGEKAGLKGKTYKSKRGLSLKHYRPEEIHNVINFRPEEIFVSNIRNGRVQYYQPTSERLGEGIEHFIFDRVTFNYEHDATMVAFGKIEATSKRLFIWEGDKRRHWEGPLALYQGLILPRKRVDELMAKEQQTKAAYQKLPSS